MNFCPLYTNKQVFDGFNEMIEALGGKPMTAEEFKSADLRNLRSGLDYAAMEAAYKIYNMNNGNFIDFAPNGQPSGLFADILKVAKTRKRAIAIKAQIYSDKFLSDRLNWIGLNESFDTDINGEPLMSFLTDGKLSLEQSPARTKAEKIAIEMGFHLLLRSVSPELFFGGKQYAQLSAGNSVSTKDVLSHLITSKQITAINSILANVLSKHDIPIILGQNEFGKPMQIVQKDGGSVIVIDESLIRDLKAYNASNMLLHEIVHALSSDALERPKTTEERLFAEATNSIYSFFDKLIPETEVSRTDSITGAYILNDVHEFAAEFATNRDARQLLYEKAIEYDRTKNGKALLKIKKFINSLSNLLFNKRLFKLKQDEFVKYKNLLDNFLLRRAVINKGNITDAELFSAVYSQIDRLSDDKLINATRRANMIKYFDGIISHAVQTDNSNDSDKEVKDLTKLRNYLAAALNTRMLAITTSKLSEEDKIRYKNAAQSLVDMLTNKKTKSITVLSRLVEQIIPQLLQDLDEIRKIKESNDSYYMYQMHDNFGTYSAMFNEIKKTLNNPEFLLVLEDELKNSSALDRLGAVKDVSALKSQVSSAMSVAEDGVGYMLYVLTNNLKNRMGIITEETGSTELAKWMNEMESIGYDTNSLLKNMGAKDGSSDTTVRAIMYLINKANRAKERAVYSKAVELTKLLSNLKAGESIKDIYEYDSEGLATGNMVRRLNYGKQKKNYKDAIKQINTLYGISEDNRRIPDDTTEVVYEPLFNKLSKHKGTKMSLRRAWNLLRNEWLANNVERKYIAKYYEAYAGLSELTLEAINNIRDRINEIKSKAKKDSQGHYLFESLSDDDWKTLSGLYIERRSLSSFININGTLKVEGTPEYQIAKELKELNEALHDKDRDYHDKKAWAEARELVKLQAIEKYTDKETGELNEKAVERTLKKWDKRNSRRRLKKDIDEKAIVYKQIDEDLYEVTKGMEEPIFEFEGDGGARYKENNKRVDDTLNIFKDSNTGEVNLDFLPASVKLRVKELQKENIAIRKAALKGNSTLQKQWKEYKKAKGKVYKKYFVSKATDYWLARYEFTDNGENLNIDDIDEKLPRWATKLIVRDIEDEETGENLQDKYTELVPGDGWISTQDRDDLLNPEFERLSKLEGNEGVSMIPKPSIYDNSKAFEKISNSPTLKALYDGVLSTMKESNNEFYSNDHTDAYRLPQITGSIFKYMASSGAKGVVKYVREQLGFIDNGLGITQDEAFGMAINTVMGNVDEFTKNVSGEDDLSASKTVGMRADKRQFNVIPPRYTTPLDDPSLISPDLIGIVCEYYESAMNTKHKDAIKDTIESFMDMLEHRDYVKQKVDRRTGEVKKRIKSGKETNTYQSARKAVDMFLYGIKSDPVEVGNWNVTKTAQLAKQATTAINLGGSAVVALTGFFTSSYAHLINSLVGNKAYGFREASGAAAIFLGHWLKNGFGLFTVGNKTSNDKVKGLMEFFNIVDQLKNKYKKSHQNRLLKIISNNYIFGMLTQLDYIIKSNIAISLALSHKYVDGRFVSKEDIRNRARNLSDDELAAQLKKWNEGESVWSILEMKNGKLQPKEGYEDAFNNVEELLYNRIIKCAENADGITTETQKAAISTSIIGAAALVHRQYLPLQIQDRYAKTVYDMDTHLYTQGMFRTVSNSLGLFVLKALRDAYFAQKADALYQWYSSVFNKKFYSDVLFDKNFYKKTGSNIKDLYKQYFSDKSSDESYMLSRARRKHMKKFAIELGMFMLAFKMLMPLLYAASDDKDNKDKLLLQLAAYTARRVEWESFNPYRFDDMVSNVKTVTAETSLIDKTQNVLSHYWVNGNLWTTLFNSDPSSEVDDNRVKRGVYKGWDKADRDWVKLLIPYHNTYEQIYGSRDKRRYYENQIMKIDKD